MIYVYLDKKDLKKYNKEIDAGLPNGDRKALGCCCYRCRDNSCAYIEGYYGFDEDFFWGGDFLIKEHFKLKKGIGVENEGADELLTINKFLSRKRRKKSNTEV